MACVHNERWWGRELSLLCKLTHSAKAIFFLNFQSVILLTGLLLFFSCHIYTVLPSNLFVIWYFPTGRSRSFRLWIWELWRDWSIRQRNETKKYNLGIVESSASNYWLQMFVACVSRRLLCKNAQNSFHLKFNTAIIIPLKIVWLINWLIGIALLRTEE